MLTLADDTILYNDLTTNHIRRPCDPEVFITHVPPPVPSKDRAFAYDIYTGTMFIVNGMGKLFHGVVIKREGKSDEIHSKELTLKAYRAIWAEAVDF